MADNNNLVMTAEVRDSFSRTLRLLSQQLKDLGKADVPAKLAKDWKGVGREVMQTSSNLSAQLLPAMRGVNLAGLAIGTGIVAAGTAMNNFATGIRNVSNLSRDLKAPVRFIEELAFLSKQVGINAGESDQALKNLFGSLKQAMNPRTFMAFRSEMTQRLGQAGHDMAQALYNAKDWDQARDIVFDAMRKASITKAEEIAEIMFGDKRYAAVARNTTASVAKLARDHGQAYADGTGKGLEEAAQKWHENLTKTDALIEKFKIATLGPLLDWTVRAVEGFGRVGDAISNAFKNASNENTLSKMNSLLGTPNKDLQRMALGEDASPTSTVASRDRLNQLLGAPNKDLQRMVQGQDASPASNQATVNRMSQLFGLPNEMISRLLGGDDATHNAGGATVNRAGRFGTGLRRIGTRAEPAAATDPDVRAEEKNTAAVEKLNRTLENPPEQSLLGRIMSALGSGPAAVDQGFGPFSGTAGLAGGAGAGSIGGGAGGIGPAGRGSGKLPGGSGRPGGVGKGSAGRHAGTSPEVFEYIRQAAIARGIDPNTAIAVANSEALRGFDPAKGNAPGDDNTSFGPFQLHYSGGRGANRSPGLGDEFTRKTGLNARDASTWKQQVDFALDNAKQGGWKPWHGSKAIGLHPWAGIGGRAGFQGGQGDDPTMPSGGVKGLVFHHTGGGGDPEGVRNTLRQRGLGVNYIMDREGNIVPGVKGTRGGHIRPGQGRGRGLSNANTVGIEIIAANDKDITPAQVEASKRFALEQGQKYGLTAGQMFGHGEINRHKQATEGSTVTGAIKSDPDLVERLSAAARARGADTIGRSNAAGAPTMKAEGNVNITLSDSLKDKNVKTSTDGMFRDVTLGRGTGMRTSEDNPLGRAQAGF